MLIFTLFLVVLLVYTFERPEKLGETFARIRTGYHERWKKDRVS